MSAILYKFYYKIPGDFNYASFKSRENLREIYRIKSKKTYDKIKNSGNKYYDKFTLIRVNHFDFDTLKRVENIDSSKMLQDENIKSVEALRMTNSFKTLYRNKSNNFFFMNKKNFFKDKRNGLSLGIRRSLN